MSVQLAIHPQRIIQQISDDGLLDSPLPMQKLVQFKSIRHCENEELFFLAGWFIPVLARPSLRSQGLPSYFFRPLFVFFLVHLHVAAFLQIIGLVHAVFRSLLPSAVSTRCLGFELVILQELFYHFEFANVVVWNFATHEFSGEGVVGHYVPGSRFLAYLREHKNYY